MSWRFNINDAKKGECEKVLSGSIYIKNTNIKRPQLGPFLQIYLMRELKLSWSPNSILPIRGRFGLLTPASMSRKGIHPRVGHIPCLR